MIKLVLSASLMLNVLLALGYLSGKNEIKSEGESLTTMGSGLVETQTVSTSMAAPKAAEKVAKIAEAKPEKTEKGSPVMVYTHDSTDEELRAANEKIQHEREEFFKTELQLTDSQMEQWEKIRTENHKKLTDLYNQNKKLFFDFDHRRKAIDLEESMHQEGAQLFGRKKWQAYLNFWERYNQNSIKNRESGDHGPVLFMEL